MKTAALLTLMGFGMLLGAACSDNAKASEACKDQKSTDTCETCCKANGASGYKYISDSCGCLGGG
jgi:hypothetical protein